MSKGKTAAIALLAFVIGLLAGWWWAQPRNAPAAPPPPPSTSAALPLPTATLGDVRFTVFRAGRLQTRTDPGRTVWLHSFEVVIENLKNPEATLESLTVEDLRLVVDGKSEPGVLRSKMNDKFTLPPGLPPGVAENALVLSGFQEFATTAPEQAPPHDNRHYTLQFTFGPSKIPVTLAPILFP